MKYYRNIAIVDVNKCRIVDDLHNILSDVIFFVLYLVDSTPSVSFANVSSYPRWPISPRIFDF